MNRRHLWPYLLVLASACASAAKPPEAPLAAPTSWTSETEVSRAIVFTPTFPPAPVSPSLAVSDDIVRLCKLELDNMDRAPKFAFDRSELLPEDTAVLDKIARCFNDGTLGWVSLQLIGHADPRGTSEYNMFLGQRRAATVAAALRDRGVDPTRIFELSRGELDAVGKDEATWAMDRRVDIIAFRPLGIEE